MIATALFSLSISAAAQEREKRVFTNDDFPPPPPAATASGDDSEGEPASEEESSEFFLDQPEYQRESAGRLHAVLREAMEEYQYKIENETLPILKERWIRMADCISVLLQDNQRTIDELDEIIKLKRQQESPNQPQ
jgi:hypothetical protein